MVVPRWKGRVVLDWSKDGRVGASEQTCVLCGRPTPLISPAGKPCHKTCAEAWTEQNEARR